jgi:DNA mismatch endonuclease (patch repair protein)
MQSNRRRDTTPELAVRRLLHRAGERYRVDFPVTAQGRRVRVDIAFPRRKLAVFVDGCYWHGCPTHGTIAAKNRDYWVAKIAENRRRDAEQAAALTGADWAVLRIWEHEPATEAVKRILGALAAIA